MPEILHLPQMAERLGVTQLWLRQQVKEGAIPAVKAGKNAILFHVGSVYEAIAELASNKPSTNACAIHHDCDLSAEPIQV